MNGASFPTISINGKGFYFTPAGGGNAVRFMVRGVALSTAGTCLGVEDILADEHNAVMTGTIIPALTALNVNVIRIYQLHAGVSHALSMQALQDAGIYVMVGLATSEYCVQQLTGAYGYGTFYRATKVVDEFQKYPNTFCFSVGNEVEFPGTQANYVYNSNPTWTTAQVVQGTVTLELQVAQALKSFARDIKAYIVAQGYRTIPVGAARQDGPQSAWTNNNGVAYYRGLVGTDTIAQYYAAGAADEAMDYVAVNSYRFKSGDGQAASAYDGLVTESEPLPVPVFLSEAGALDQVVRDWHEVPNMYRVSSPPQPVAWYEQLSGEIAFELLEETNGFGLYTISAGSPPDGYQLADNDTGATALAAEFAAVKAAYPNPPAPASTPASPTTAPASFSSNPVVTVTWPELLTPYTVMTPNAAITVENYFTGGEIQITQYGTVMGTVAAAASATSPTSAAVTVFAGAALSIQANNGGSWDALCGVAASNVAAGITVKTDVAWGPYVGCNVNLAAPISVTFRNYSLNAATVEVDGNKVTLAAAPTKDSYSSQTVPITDLRPLQLMDTVNPGNAICSVSPMLLQNGATVEDNLSWGQACNIPLATPITVVVENFNPAEVTVNVGWAIGTVPAAGSPGSSSASFQLDNLNNLWLQAGGETVCYVPAAALQDGMTIRDNVDTPGPGTICLLSFNNG